MHGDRYLRSPPTLSETSMWVQHAGTKSFLPHPLSAKVYDKLPSGIYTVSKTLDGISLNSVEVKAEELLLFSDGPINTVYEEVTKFWTMKDKYALLNLPYRRGILLHGKPGTGKTGIIRLIANKVVDDKGIVCIIQSDDELELWEYLLKNYELPQSPLFIMEDLDSLLNYGESTIINLLDGLYSGVSGAVFLATTNYLENISPRVIRPSRFDQIIEVDVPSIKIRREYLTSLYRKYQLPLNLDLVNASSNLSFASVKELFIAHTLYKADIKETVKRLISIQERTLDE